MNGLAVEGLVFLVDFKESGHCFHRILLQGAAVLPGDVCIMFLMFASSSLSGCDELELEDLISQVHGGTESCQATVCQR